jgi:hypothetical protein
MARAIAGCVGTPGLLNKHLTMPGGGEQCARNSASQYFSGDEIQGAL